MPSKTTLIFRVARLVAALGLLGTEAVAFSASAEKVLYSFCSVSGCEDGSGPLASLIFDSAGNLYGTTNRGGDYNYGSVFELTRNGDGKWTEAVLYSFCPAKGCADGAYPSGTLVFDSAGSLYGTTPSGGSKASDGVVFQLTPGANGQWTETVIHAFKGRSGGSVPGPSLVFGPAGGLYGTTTGGPECRRCGLVFELTPGADGKWNEKLLHSFSNDSKDGAGPPSALTFDASGNLYGTTPGGGTGACQDGDPKGCGTVFELIHGKNGNWTEKVLYSFKDNHKDGTAPAGRLVLDAAGDIYGTTEIGGSGSGCHEQDGTYGCGTVFELTHEANGKWTEKVLHNFTSNGRDGVVPSAGVVFDAVGILYGTTGLGGAGNPPSGSVFELTPRSNGKWTETVLYSFCSLSDCMDGAYPSGTLIFDTAGNLYGTTSEGGNPHDGGAVFEITP